MKNFWKYITAKENSIIILMAVGILLIYFLAPKIEKKKLDNTAHEAVIIVNKVQNKVALILYNSEAGEEQIYWMDSMNIQGPNTYYYVE